MLDYFPSFTMLKIMSCFPFILQKMVIYFFFSKYQYEFMDLSVFAVFQSIEIIIQLGAQIVPFFGQWELFYMDS